ncbi:MAG TPA: 50S ribosomal protein L25 [Pyrinomonadaceae bacterium]|nr:50S ribosomal protein L25 [Pyrinomonadaceae bacterium]
MAERKEFTIKAERREGRGKNDARRLRASGKVPLTIYGGEGDAVAASASLAELAAILRTESGHNTIFTLDVDGEGGHDVMFIDRQIDPVRGRLVHADLRRLVRGQKIEVTVPLHLVGEPIGVTDGGGVLEQMVREIEIRVSPRDIPDAINLDVSNLGVHDVLHVSDIPADEKVEILSEPDTVLATVGVVRDEPVETPATTEEGAAEPEVIGKGKKDDEGGEA